MQCRTILARSFFALLSLKQLTMKPRLVFSEVLRRIFLWSNCVHILPSFCSTSLEHYTTCLQTLEYSVWCVITRTSNKTIGFVRSQASDLLAKLFNHLFAIDKGVRDGTKFYRHMIVAIDEVLSEMTNKSDQSKVLSCVQSEHPNLFKLMAIVACYLDSPDDIFRPFATRKLFKASDFYISISLWYQGIRSWRPEKPTVFSIKYVISYRKEYLHLCRHVLK